VLPEVSKIGYRYRVVPCRLWRFCATSERPTRSKTKLVLQYITMILSVTHIYPYNIHVNVHSCILYTSLYLYDPVCACVFVYLCVYLSACASEGVSGVSLRISVKVYDIVCMQVCIQLHSCTHWILCVSSSTCPARQLPVCLHICHLSIYPVCWLDLPSANPSINIYTVKNKVRMRFWLRVMVARLAPPPRQSHSNWGNTCKYAETQLECGAKIGKKM